MKTYTVIIDCANKWAFMGQLDIIDRNAFNIAEILWDEPELKNNRDRRIIFKTTSENFLVLKLTFPFITESIE